MTSMKSVASDQPGRDVDLGGVVRPAGDPCGCSDLIPRPIRAALLGPSFTVPIAGGRLEHGTWQQIVLCDFDNRSRSRKIGLQAKGV